MPDDYILYILLIGLAVIWIPWLLAHKIRPFFGKKALRKWLLARQHKNTVEEGLDMLHALYAKTNAHKISKNYRKRKGIHSEKFLYGEVYPVTLIKLLDLAKPAPNDIFYDLGSGAGQAVILADKCYPFSKCKGIELLPALYHLSEEKRIDYENEAKQKEPETKTNIEFIEGSFLEHDFSDADIVFINATAFKGDIWEQLTKKLNMLNSGSRVIVTSLTLDPAQFEEIYHDHEVMSWGFCTVRIYKHT